MSNESKTVITIEAIVNAPLEKVWLCWTTPDYIIQWNSASEEWHTPRAENDLQTGGRFSSRMESRDGTMGFDFEGVYDDVIPHQLISYTMADGRQVKITFTSTPAGTQVVESFDAENTHSHEMQRAGWQSILDNFKRFVENQ